MIGLIRNAMAEGKTAQPVTASLFFNKDLGIDDIRFDLFIDEQHKLEFQMSEHPVQDGAVITDHVYQKLRTCTVNGMFTNHSAKKRSGNVSTISIAGYENADVMQNVAKDNYIKLEEYARRKLPVRLVTSLITYPKMIIKSITTKRGPSDGECVKFTMTLSEFKSVTLFEISSDYVYKPESMEKAIDQLIASPVNSGLSSGVLKQVTEMKVMLGVQQ